MRRIEVVGYGRQAVENGAAKSPRGYSEKKQDEPG
jgi:hypothetical protein